MASVIQCTCSHCGCVRFYDGSGPPEQTSAVIRLLSEEECPRCRGRGVVVTLDAELPPDRELEVLPPAGHPSLGGAYFR
jgi:hypothetical protein